MCAVVRQRRVGVAISGDPLRGTLAGIGGLCRCCVGVYTLCMTAVIVLAREIAEVGCSEGRGGLLWGPPCIQPPGPPVLRYSIYVPPRSCWPPLAASRPGCMLGGNGRRAGRRPGGPGPRADYGLAPCSARSFYWLQLSCVPHCGFVSGERCGSGGC